MLETSECEERIVSISSNVPRELSEEEIEKLKKQDIVNDFKQKQLELNAQKNWDRFYHRNKDNFFKDRNWSTQDIQEICSDLDLHDNLIFLESGCGVGNFLFPFAKTYSNLQLQAFDFSKNAIEFLQKRAQLLKINIESCILDLSAPLLKSPFTTEADIATLIFVLSAIHPEKHQLVADNMAKLVKIGGSVVCRDYAINDYAMVRFGRGSKLSERFYTRQDGTRAYYFEKQEFSQLFEKAGFCVTFCEYLHRKTINHQKSLNVPRTFLQARFVRIK